MLMSASESKWTFFPLFSSLWLACMCMHVFLLLMRLMGKELLEDFETIFEDKLCFPIDIVDICIFLCPLYTGEKL